MEQISFILPFITLGFLLIFIVFYFVQENKNKIVRENQFSKTNTQFETLHAEGQKSSNQLSELLLNLSQESHLHSEMLNKEFIKSHKLLTEQISQINIAFINYTKKVQDSLVKYANDNEEMKKETINLKQQIKVDLENILKEIKMPLDLD